MIRLVASVRLSACPPVCPVNLTLEFFFYDFLVKRCYKKFFYQFCQKKKCLEGVQEKKMLGGSLKTKIRLWKSATRPPLR